MSIIGDSIDHKILSITGQDGKLDNKNVLDTLLSKATSQKIDYTKPLVIIYYQGPDRCNSFSSATNNSENIWYKKMEKGIRKITESNVLYIYDDKEGLIYGKRDWFKDPNNIITNFFFKRHYPCSSFVIIRKDGNFISHFGEYGIASVWKTLKKLMEIE